MAYMNASTVRQVGFRPYGLTNPRRAANLSGLGAAQHDLNRPFDPWRLHADNLGDLGQNHPFDQDPGGWVLHGLGAISPERIALAEEGGISAADLDLLASVGATDNDIGDLLNGTISLAQLYANYGVTISPGSGIQICDHPYAGYSPGQQVIFGATAESEPQTPCIQPGSSTHTVPASTSPVGAAPEVPVGSTLSYSASWNNPSALAFAGTGVVAKLISQLPNYGLSVLDSNVMGHGVLGQSEISLLLQTSVAHASRNDVASIVTSLLQQLVGNTFTATPQISVISAGPHQSVPATAIPPGPASQGGGATVPDFMTQQSIFPGFTNEVLIFGAVGIGLLFAFTRRR